MEIKVLGTGCKKCKTLFSNVENALKETGIAANIEKIEDIREIIKYKVMSTPALVINGTVVSAGKLSNTEEIKTLIGGSK
jgi:small redox-active disulfide protein 2